jgi:opacity protein-like surface antigen
MKFTILTLAACAALTGPVFAAGVTPTVPHGPPVFVSNPWEGFYVGGHAGYAFGTSSYENNPPGERHNMFDQPGKLKFLFCANDGFMCSFNQAVAQGSATGTTPDISTVRARRVKVGGGVNFENFWH